jgi:glycosyltransferase involved in cell wall biosynthesis
MSAPLSVVAITSELPWPLNTGGHLRTFHLLRAAGQRCALRLIAPVFPGQGEALERLREHGIDVQPVPVPPRSAPREALRLLGALARREPYVCFHRHDWQAVRAAVRREAAERRPDVLYLDHLDSLVYRDLLPATPAVLDLHNVYSVLTQRTACESASAWRSRYLRREGHLLARMEERAARSAEVISAVSEAEGMHFQALGARAVYVAPNGVDCAAYAGLPAGRAGGRPLLLYIGAMSWGPNIAAVRFLARTVLPQVQECFPDAGLRVVGKDPAAEVRALAALPGVEVTGGVPDVIPHLREASVLAVPLESGGGTRLKILEAFAAGLPVVSTPIGCEGLRVVHGHHLWVAPREEFASGVCAVLGDESLAGQLAEKGRALARAVYDWRRIGAVTRAALEAAASAHSAARLPERRAFVP